MTANDNADRNFDNVAGETSADSSIWSIMAGVFTGPTEAFAAFNRKPRILIVLLIAIILGFAGNYFMTEYSARMQYDMVSQSTTIPAEQLEQMRADAEDPDRLMGGVFAAVFQIIGGLIIALVAWGIGSFLMGGDSTFKKVWGVTLLGGLIPLLGAIVKIPLVIAKDSFYVSLGPAALFPDKDFTSIMYGVLSFFDVFMIWALIVTGIGFAAVFNISRGKGITIALILDLLFIFVMIGLMSVGMGLAGVEITFF
jgi:hypothetical protein